MSFRSHCLRSAHIASALRESEINQRLFDERRRQHRKGCLAQFFGALFVAALLVAGFIVCMAVEGCL